MLFVLLVLAVSAFVSRAEQVPCTTGKEKCDGSQNLSILNNNYFCCESSFSMQWNSEVINDTTIETCTCNRQFYVSDCIEGAVECRGASSLSSDGISVKCCKNGESMNVVNSFINGVKVDSCKCSRGGIVNVNGVFRPMTDAERAQFTSSMNQFSKDLQNGLSRMTQTLGQSLGLLTSDLVRAPVRPGGVDNWASNLINEFGQGFLRRSYQPFGPSWLPRNGISTGSNSMSAQAVPVSSPRPSWDVRQRRLQELQRRLQQQQRLQNGPGLTFLDRLSRHPVIAQILNPGWWLNQNWGAMFGPSRNQRHNASQIVRNNDNINDGDKRPINLNSTLPAQTTNTTA